MVTRRHEAPIELFGNLPELILRILPKAGLRADDNATVAYASERATQIDPAELHVDKVPKVTYPNGEDLLIAFEVQLRKDRAKKYTWPVYAADVRRQHRRPVALVVWCYDKATADWAAEPISLGPLGTLHPVVLSPETFPSDPVNWKDDIATALLTALMHQDSPAFGDIAEALLRLLEKVEADRARMYTVNLARVLDDSAKHLLEGTMKTMPLDYTGTFLEGTYNDGREEGREDGRLAEARDTLLRILAIRELHVDDETKKLITDTTDLQRLHHWRDAAITADTTAEVFTTT